jgi:hypothetical protein
MNRFINYFGALFMERSTNNSWRISIGRVSWLAAFIPALYVWIESGGQQDIAPHHLTVLLLLAAYNFGKKGLKIIKNKMPVNENGPG